MGAYLLVVARSVDSGSVAIAFLKQAPLAELTKRMKTIDVIFI